MSTHRKLTTVCCAAVLALGLAACGSSSDDDDQTGMDGDGTQMPTEPAGPTAADLFTVAQDSRSAAMAAGEAADDALENAEKYDGMLLTDSVAGDSGQAMANAQAILDAQTAASNAVDAAQEALDAANEAKDDADAIEDGAQKDSLIEAIDEAIEEAKAALKTATDIRDGRELERAAEAVTGGPTADPQGTPRSIADTVGMSIASGLLPGTMDGRTRGEHGATAPAATIDKDHKVELNDGKGHTWAEIVGEDNLTTMPIGTDRAPVKVASIAGMTPAMVWASVPTAITDLAAAAATNGAMFADADYNGIGGTAYCLGTDCKVTEGKLAGSWYFAQTAANAATPYVSNPNRDEREMTPYVAETLFARFGHWIELDNTDWEVNTFALSGGGTAVSVAANADLDDDDKATYSGSAAGMSAYKTPKASGMGDHIDTGRFTADVSLNATFGGTPVVRGTIDNFQGDAVGNWTVTLESATLDTSEESGTAVSTGRDGSWSATAYGNDADKRPAGIFGGFSAHFSDGHAAGAYATRKD